MSNLKSEKKRKRNPTNKIKVSHSRFVKNNRLGKSCRGKQQKRPTELNAIEIDEDQAKKEKPKGLTNNVAKRIFIKIETTAINKAIFCFSNV